VNGGLKKYFLPRQVVTPLQLLAVASSVPDGNNILSQKKVCHSAGDPLVKRDPHAER
jgi:hypothetical protein